MNDSWTQQCNAKYYYVPTLDTRLEKLSAFLTEEIDRINADKEDDIISKVINNKLLETY